MMELLESIIELLSINAEESVEAISDAEYAEEIQVQEVLQASMADLQISHQENVRSIGNETEEEVGESSTEYCEICMERKVRNDMFKLEGCSHSFCSDCVSRHVQVKIQENNPIIKCPDLYCDFIIDPPSCRAIIPGSVLDMWEESWNRASIPESQKIYCPFEDCSAMLVIDAEEEEQNISESECPVCQRLFCAKCRVPWHSGIECEEFQKLKGDERGHHDLMLHVLAKENQWTKCPNCKYLVDKVEGCIHMTCRCGYEFCYKCGLNWSERHWSCQA